MPITVLGGTKVADTTFSVANSCRFNRPDNATMTKTQSDGDQDKWTFSVWFKLGSTFSTIRYLLTAKTDSVNYVTIEMDGANQLRFGVLKSGAYDSFKRSNAYFRDVSAWYHLVCVYDSENGTAGHRQRVYLNGVEMTSWAADNTTTQNEDSAMNDSGSTMILGNLDGESSWWDGYMAEVCLCDGQAYAASDFGEFDETSPNMWKPKDVSGLTFGTNGFYLDFEDSSNLGNDANGGTDLTESNFAAIDQATDTPTNNFATFNPLVKAGGSLSWSQGNCVATLDADGYESTFSTILVETGKWYVEFMWLAGSHQYTGIQGGDAINEAASNVISSEAPCITYAQSGIKDISAAQTSYGNSYATNDIVGVALDYDNNKIYFSKNGTWQNSGDPESGGTGTGAIDLVDTDTAYAFGVSKYESSGSVGVNFGGCPGFTISSGNADENGYGNFEYAPPDGYLALCTKNLATEG